MNAVVVAESILAERRDRRLAARLVRVAQPKVQLNLRVSGDIAEILDAWATMRGETIDVFVERTIREAAR